MCARGVPSLACASRVTSTPQKKILEFVFERVSITVGPSGSFTFELDKTQWNNAKSAEQKAVNGEGRIERATPGKKGSNPFFKFCYADDRCIVARGRGGGLALWAKEAP